jgi:hypothetical protein
VELHSEIGTTDSPNYCKYWKKDKAQLTRMHKEHKPLEKIYDWEDNWDWLCEKVSGLLPPDEHDERVWQPKKLREFLNNKQNWSDDDIWQALIEICDERVELCGQQIAGLERQKPKNRLKLEVIGKLGSIPKKDELDRLLRYGSQVPKECRVNLAMAYVVRRLAPEKVCMVLIQTAATTAISAASMSVFMARVQAAMTRGFLA